MSTTPDEPTTPPSRSFAWPQHRAPVGRHRRRGRAGLFTRLFRLNTGEELFDRTVSAQLEFLGFILFSVFLFEAIAWSAWLNAVFNGHPREVSAATAAAVLVGTLTAGIIIGFERLIVTMRLTLSAVPSLVVRVALIAGAAHCVHPVLVDYAFHADIEQVRLREQVIEHAVEGYKRIQDLSVQRDHRDTDYLRAVAGDREAARVDQLQARTEEYDKNVAEAHRRSEAAGNELLRAEAEREPLADALAQAAAEVETARKGVSYARFKARSAGDDLAQRRAKSALYRAQRKLKKRQAVAADAVGALQAQEEVIAARRRAVDKATGDVTAWTSSRQTIAGEITEIREEHAEAIEKLRGTQRGDKDKAQSELERFRTWIRQLKAGAANRVVEAGKHIHGTPLVFEAREYTFSERKRVVADLLAGNPVQTPEESEHILEAIRLEVPGLLPSADMSSARLMRQRSARSSTSSDYYWAILLFLFAAPGLSIGAKLTQDRTLKQYYDDRCQALAGSACAQLREWVASTEPPRDRRSRRHHDIAVDQLPVDAFAPVATPQPPETHQAVDAGATQPVQSSEAPWLYNVASRRSIGFFSGSGSESDPAGPVPGGSV